MRSSLNTDQENEQPDSRVLPADLINKAAEATIRSGTSIETLYRGLDPTIAGDPKLTGSRNSDIGTIFHHFNDINKMNMSTNARVPLLFILYNAQTASGLGKNTEYITLQEACNELRMELEKRNIHFDDPDPYKGRQSDARAGRLQDLPGKNRRTWRSKWIWAGFGLSVALPIYALIANHNSKVVLPNLSEAAAPGFAGVVVACDASASNDTRRARDDLWKALEGLPPPSQACPVEIENSNRLTWHRGSTIEDILSEMGKKGFSLLVIVEPDGSSKPTQHARFVTHHNTFLTTVLDRNLPSIPKENVPTELAQVIRALAVVLGGRVDRSSFDLKAPDANIVGDDVLLLAVWIRQLAGLSPQQDEIKNLDKMLHRRACATTSSDFCCLAQALFEARDHASEAVLDITKCETLKTSGWPLVATTPRLARAYEHIRKGSLPHAARQIREAYHVTSIALTILRDRRENDFMVPGVGWAKGASFLRKELLNRSGGDDAIPPDAELEELAELEFDVKWHTHHPENARMVAESLEERATWRGRAGEWNAAARDALTAAELTGDLVHWLSWVEAALLADETPPLETMMTRIADHPSELPALRLYATFLRWLLALRSGVAASPDQILLRNLYEQTLLGEVAFDDEDRALENLVCFRKPNWSANTCDTYKILTTKREIDSTKKLAQSLFGRTPDGR